VEKYDISYGETGRVRMTFSPGEFGIVFRIPYGDLDFFRWLWLDILGKVRLPKLLKGAGKYEYKIVLDRTGRTAFRWMKVWEEKGLVLTSIRRGRGEV